MPQFTGSPALQARVGTFDYPAIQEQANRRQLQEAELQKMQAEAQRLQSGQLTPEQDLAERRFGLAEDKDAREQATEKVQQLSNLLAPYADPSISELQKSQMWSQTLQQAQGLGLPTDNAPQTYDPEWIMRTRAQVGDYKNKLEEMEGKAPKVETFYTDEGGSQKRQWNPQTQEWDAVGGTKPPSGMSIESDGKGGFRLVQGVDAGKGGLERKTIGTIEDKLMATANNLARLDIIREQYKRKFLEWGPRISARILSWKSKLGKKLSPEENKFIREISSFNRDSIENINLYIKEITGAQMSNQEAGRIRLAQPDPGEGIFGGDAPEVFEAKLESAYASIKRAQARYTYWLRQGVDMGDMTEAQREAFTRENTLEGITKIMKDRESKIIDQTRQSNPGINDDDLKAILRRTLAQEFGV